MAYVKDGVLYDEWVIADVKTLTDGTFKMPLTDDECLSVLDLMAEHHDANQGLNWDVMQYCIEELYPNRELTEEET